MNTNLLVQIILMFLTTGFVAFVFKLSVKNVIEDVMDKKGINEKITKIDEKINNLNKFFVLKEDCDKVHKMQEKLNEDTLKMYEERLNKIEEQTKEINDKFNSLFEKIGGLSASMLIVIEELKGFKK